MELIMVKCSECEESYLTIYKSGNSECPSCKHVNKILVGKDAEEKLKECEKVGN